MCKTESCNNVGKLRNKNGRKYREKHCGSCQRGLTPDKRGRPNNPVYAPRPLNQTKVCNTCGIEKSRDAFFKRIDRPNGQGLRSDCADCYAAKIKPKRNRSYIRRFSTYDGKLGIKDKMLQANYNITIDEYEERLYVRQQGVCPLCLEQALSSIEAMLEGRFWPVDHDHSCCPGSKSCGLCVRGIVCVGCNNTLTEKVQQEGWLDRARLYLTHNQDLTDNSYRGLIGG